jgi:2-alkenal reductase
MFPFLAALFLILIISACSIFSSTPPAPSLTLPTPVDTVVELLPVQDEAGPTALSQDEPGISGRTAQSQPAADLEARLIEIYRQLNPSVVYIITPLGSGSGFVYNQQGMIVTNNHVISGARNYEVVFASGDRQRASLVGADVDSDLAVIQVEQLPDGVEPVALADPDSILVGQFVVAIGNPFGEQGSMSLGIISGLGRSLPSQRELDIGSSYSLPGVIQTDAPINPGNSGGPLLNLNGELVGINAAIASATGTNSGVGFAIPVGAVERIVPVLIEEGSYEYPYIGATFASELSLDAASQLGLPQTRGAYVTGVTRGSPADRAGLVAADNSGRGGDLIVALDGQTIDDFSDLNSYLVFHTSVGQTIEVTVLRGDRQVTFPLTLGARP